MISLTQKNEVTKLVLGGELGTLSKQLHMLRDFIGSYVQSLCGRKIGRVPVCHNEIDMFCDYLMIKYAYKSLICNPVSLRTW